MTTNDAITIYNRHLSADRKETLTPTVIKYASWYESKGAAGAPDASDTSTYKVRIPYDADQSGKTYIDALSYKKMEADKAKAYWTIQKGDIVVRGECTEQIASLKDLTSSFSDVFVVDNFSDDTIRGHSFTKHWRIGGT